jgi:hypothetical protein
MKTFRIIFVNESGDKQTIDIEAINHEIAFNEFKKRLSDEGTDYKVIIEFDEL